MERQVVGVNHLGDGVHMDNRTFLDLLLKAENIRGLEDALARYRLDAEEEWSEIPVGRRPNNRGAIEVASDPGRSAIERVTNAQDAVLELEHQRHGGKPECRSPREAASAWLGVPEKDGLAGLSLKARQDLAHKTVVRLEPGEGAQSRLLSVIDQGIGISPDQFETTILSLNESNKIQKHYLAGTYGQGGSSTFAFSRYVLIASRKIATNEIVFTVVRYLDLPAEKFKTGHYVYAVHKGKPITAAANSGDLKHGTIVKHFGFDLSNYGSPIGPKSIYGVLQRVLFDPVAPVRFENRVHGWNRVIKGVRNALNGAQDQGDEGKGPDLNYQLPAFHVALGDYGSIGIEYWVLKRPTDDKGQARKSPTDAFVDSRKPIVLTHNGQNQGELSALLVRRDAELPFLRNRIIVQINCDHLTPAAKRLLFSSTREQSREGYLLNRIQDEVISLLRSDDELRRLNAEARDSTLQEQDETAKEQMRRQVARLLRLVGPAVVSSAGPANKPGDGRSGGKRLKAKPEPITPKDPPTYIRIVWDDDAPIGFYAGQRRYIRIETDADSIYHNPDQPQLSRINVAVGDDLKVVGTSPLRGGRMRIGIECSSAVVMGGKGSIRVELYRTGLSTLSDERAYDIVQMPEPKEPKATTSMPNFEVIAVEGPGAENWEYISDTADDDPSRHASGAEMSNGTLYIYYSQVFPRFAVEMKRFEIQDASLATSFRKRYEMWLAVHALLLHQDDQEIDIAGLDEPTSLEMQRQERCRAANVAALIALQEVKTGATGTAEAEAA
jgi:hypothetical protein